MQRIRVVAPFFLFLALVLARPLCGQDFSFSATNKTVPGLTNRGAVGAISANGLLGSGTPTNLLDFQATDVAVSSPVQGSPSIYAVGMSFNRPHLIILSALNDGTFSLPQSVLLAGQPTSVSVSDIDLDGFDDVVVTEAGNSGPDTGSIEVFTGKFLSTGNPTLFDFSNLAALKGGNGKFAISGGFPLSATVNRFNNDAIGDIAFVTALGSLGIIYSTPSGFAQPRIFGTVQLSAPFAPAPRLLASGISNMPLGGVLNNLIGLFVATIGGIKIFDNNGGDGFADAGTVSAGTAPIGVVVGDVNNDGVPDLIALNAGSSNVTTNLALPGGGYGLMIPSFVGANPVSLTLLNFNNDGRADIAVVSAPGFGVPGTVFVLQGDGKGAFNPATTVATDSPTSVAAGHLVTASKGNDLVIGGFRGVQSLANKLGTYDPVLLQIFSAVSLTADFDRSGGGDDLVVIEQNRGLVFVLLNVKAGLFSPAVQILDVNDLFTTKNFTPTSATAFRDAQTGLNDIAITEVPAPTDTSSNGQIIVMLNNGTGVFSDFGSFRRFPGSRGATNIMAGDFNNDGADDLAWIDFETNAAYVALNDGANFFTKINFRETGGFVPVSARLADINDDDNLDLVVVNQGDASHGGQSVVTTLLGNGEGGLVPTGALLNVPNIALAIVGGLADIEANGIERIVDFNNDGYPDLAVATTCGFFFPDGSSAPTVTLLLNRPDSPGNFNVQPPIPLVDDTQPTVNLQLEADKGGPGLVSGRNGDPSIPPIGRGQGGANYVMAVGDFNADGSPDLVVTGTAPLFFDIDGNGIGDTGTPVAGLPGVPVASNFRAAIYLVGNSTAGTMRVSRPLRFTQYTLSGSSNPFTEGADTFVACATGNFGGLDRFVPDVFHISLNGNIWVDANTTSILNHAPILTIRRSDLNAPLGQGRKEIITSGQSATVPVTGFDADGDKLTFSLVATPTGEQPPSFVTIKDNWNNTATVQINSADANRGPGDARFRIAVEATDGSSTGPGGRLPLTGRAYFTLIVKPNQPPTIGPIANQTIEAGATRSIAVTASDPDAGDTLILHLTSAPLFVSLSDFLNGTGAIRIAPTSADTGTTACTVAVGDQFGLSASTSFSITVTPGRTTINWNNPGDITYGTALSATQLNATATVSGNFVYTPAVGKVLSAGTQTLSTTFTPTDSTLPPVTKSVQINVLKALLTVSADDKTKVYGAPLPQFTATFKGFVNGDNASAVSGMPSLSTTATAASDVGVYAIAVAQGTLTAANYSFELVPAKLTVKPAPLAATAFNASRPYGYPNPPLGGSLIGEVNGDNIAASFNTTAAQTSDAGDYPIVPVLFDPNGRLFNYSVTLNNGVLTITKVLLTVTADDKTVFMLDPLPTFTARYAGFVLGQTSGVLSGSPAFSTLATSSSPPGKYPIVVTLGSLSARNYRFTFVNGTLTVLGPQQILQLAASMTAKLRDGATNPDDRKKLDKVFDLLTDSNATVLWIDTAHPQSEGGKQVFHDAREAEVKLMDLLRNNKSGLGAKDLQPIIDVVAKACRIAAVVAIRDAESAALDPKKVAKAKAELSRGDAAAQDQHPQVAIEAYGDAWKMLAGK